MQKILVIGSAGFVGSNLIRWLSYNKKNNLIIGIDKLNLPNSIHNVYMNKSAEFYLADILNQDIFNKIYSYNEPDIIIYLADNKWATYSNEFSKNIQNNINGLSNVLNTLISKNFRGKFIYVSDIGNNYITNYNQFFLTKEYEENLIASFKNELNYDIIRCVDLFGARDRSGTISHLINSIVYDKQIFITNDGKNILNMLHTDDLCKAISLIADNNYVNNIYEISSKTDFTEIEIIHIIMDIFDIKNIKIDNVDSIELMNREIDTNKIIELGWNESKFKEKLIQTILWYKNNSWFFRNGK